MRIEEIVASLERRGFYAGEIDLDEAGVQVWAVVEELGEVARLLRRRAQRGNEPDMHKIATEAADVVIAAVCLLACCAGDNAAAVVAAKATSDEDRGWLHGGANAPTG